MNKFFLEIVFFFLGVCLQNISAQDYVREFATRNKKITIEAINGQEKNSPLTVKIITQISPNSELNQFGLIYNNIEAKYIIGRDFKKTLPLTFTLFSDSTSVSKILILRIIVDTTSKIFKNINKIPVFKDIYDTLRFLIKRDFSKKQSSVTKRKVIQDNLETVGFDFSKEIKISDLLYFDGKSYFYQIGSFKNKKRAAKLYTKIKKQQIKGFFYPAHPANKKGVWYRVGVGPYFGTDTLRRELNKLHIRFNY